MTYIATGVTGLELAQTPFTGGHTTLAAKNPDTLQVSTRSVEDQCKDYLPAPLVPYCVAIQAKTHERPIDVAKALLGQTPTQAQATLAKLAAEVRTEQAKIVESQKPKSNMLLYAAIGGAGLLAFLWFRRKKHSTSKETP